MRVIGVAVGSAEESSVLVLLCLGRQLCFMIYVIMGCDINCIRREQRLEAEEIT